MMNFILSKNEAEEIQTKLFSSLRKLKKYVVHLEHVSFSFTSDKDSLTAIIISLSHYLSWREIVSWARCPVGLRRCDKAGSFDKLGSRSIQGPRNQSTHLKHRNKKVTH